MIDRTNTQHSYHHFIVALLMLWLCTPLGVGLAEDSKTTDPIMEHLEFLGYRCDVIEQGIRAQHHSKIHLYVTYSRGGIRVQTGFPGKEAGTSGLARYEVLNTLNIKTRVTRYYWSKNGNLFGEAWMPGVYDRSRFATFMEAWEDDTQLLRSEYQQLEPFLKEPTSEAETNS